MATKATNERGNGLFGWDHRYAVSHAAERPVPVATWLEARAAAAPEAEAGERGNGLWGWDHRYAVSHAAERLASVAAWLEARAATAPDSEADAWGPLRARLAELTRGIVGLAGQLGYDPAAPVAA